MLPTLLVGCRSTGLATNGNGVRSNHRDAKARLRSRDAHGVTSVRSFLTMSNPVTAKCWCLACDPKSGEIGLKCKKRTKGKEKTKKKTFAALKKAVDNLIWTINKDHGGGHHDDECIVCRAIHKAEEEAGLSHDY